MRVFQTRLLAVSLLFSIAVPYKVIVIGDVHGDFDQLLSVLVHNNVIDSHHKWVLQNDSKVIQLGDMIDRGYDDKRVLEWIHKTQIAHRGAWTQLLGNHELMNLRGRFGYAVDGLPGIGFGDISLRKAAMQSGEIGSWLKSLPVMHMEGEILFVHANVDLEVVGNRHWTSINNEIRNNIQSCPHGDCKKISLLERGLLWSRQLVSQVASDDCSNVLELLRRFNATHLVLGHTIDHDLPRYCDSRVFQADVGMSRYYKHKDGYVRNVVFEINGTTGTVVGYDIVHTPTVSDPFGPEETIFRSFIPDAYSILGLSAEDHPSVSAIRRAYRRLPERSRAQTRAYALFRSRHLRKAYDKWLKRNEPGNERGRAQVEAEQAHQTAASTDNRTHPDL